MPFFFPIYNEIIYRPLLNALVGIYAALPYQDLGLAILVMTVLIRVLLHPLISKTVRSQLAMARIQPRLRELQERYKQNREELAKKTMEFYKAEGVHPLSGCLPVLVQVPILIGLYQVFWKGIQLSDASLLYSFIPHIAAFDPVGLGLFDLSKPNPMLAILAGASQFLQGRLLPAPAPPAAGKSSDFERAMRAQTVYFLPLIVAGISWTLPSALAFYWTILNLFAIVQQLWIQRRLSHERTGPSSRTP